MLADKQHCTGCNACGMICPTQCIQSLQDEEGFYYPSIDESKCIQCGACTKVCPILHASEKQEPKALYYGAQRDKSRLYESSSGGILTKLYEAFEEKGYRTYGVVYSEDNYHVHCKDNHQTNFKDFRKSKYIECEPLQIHTAIEQQLFANETILFCGTPCQVNGVNAYLREHKVPTQKFYTVSFICHGVPSQKLWEAYLKKQEATYGAKCDHVDFRSKKYGWDYSNVMQLQFENGKAYIGDYFTDDYYRMFVYDKSLRPSCYHCHALQQCGADVIVGDYINAPTKLRNQYRAGLSIFAVISEKGQSLMTTYLKECDLQPLKHKDLYVDRKKDIPPSREKLYKEVREKQGFPVMEDKHLPWLRKIRSHVMRHRSLRNVIEIVYFYIR